VAGHPKHARIHQFNIHHQLQHFDAFHFTMITLLQNMQTFAAELNRTVSFVLHKNVLKITSRIKIS